MSTLHGSIDRNDSGQLVFVGMRTTCMSVSPHPRLSVIRSQAQGKCANVSDALNRKHRGGSLIVRRDLVGYNEQTGEMYCRHCLLGLTKTQVLAALNTYWESVLGEPESAIRFDDIWNHRAGPNP